MPSLHHSIAALRIAGDSLVPDAVSRLLCCNPTTAFVKGQVEPSKGKPLVRNTSLWHLDVVGQQPENLDAHVAELFGRVNADLSVWTTLSGEFQAELLCVYFTSETDNHLEVSREVLTALGDRGIKLALQIYAPITGRSPSLAGQSRRS